MHEADVTAMPSDAVEVPTSNAPTADGIKQINLPLSKRPQPLQHATTSENGELLSLRKVCHVSTVLEWLY